MKTYKELRQEKQSKAEDSLIKQAMYLPNEMLVYNDRAFTVKYPFVKDNTLMYMLKGKTRYYEVSEEAVLKPINTPPNQI